MGLFDKKVKIVVHTSERPKGYTPSHERNNCDNCCFHRWEGKGSRTQQMSVCTVLGIKANGKFMVGLEDTCDEFEQDTNVKVE
jgi:hypothetical protein